MCTSSWARIPSSSAGWAAVSSPELIVSEHGPEALDGCFPESEEGPTDRPTDEQLGEMSIPCPTCGYSLLGLVKGLCPECGIPFDKRKILAP
jgi:endogenous inhibitor of DNA gyrase (YacG/DUF329 family)